MPSSFGIPTVPSNVFGSAALRRKIPDRNEQSCFAKLAEPNAVVPLGKKVACSGSDKPLNESTCPKSLAELKPCTHCQTSGGLNVVMWDCLRRTLSRFELPNCSTSGQLLVIGDQRRVSFQAGCDPAETTGARSLEKRGEEHLRSVVIQSAVP